MFDKRMYDELKNMGFSEEQIQYGLGVSDFLRHKMNWKYWIFFCMQCGSVDAAVEYIFKITEDMEKKEQERVEKKFPNK